MTPSRRIGRPLKRNCWRSCGRRMTKRDLSGVLLLAGQGVAPVLTIRTEPTSNSILIAPTQPPHPLAPARSPHPPRRIGTAAWSVIQLFLLPSRCCHREIQRTAIPLQIKTRKDRQQLTIQKSLRMILAPRPPQSRM